MLPQEIIRKKRNRQALTAAEIAFFIRGVTDGTIVDAQTAALTMAVFLNGMNVKETTALTLICAIPETFSNGKNLTVRW